MNPMKPLIRFRFLLAACWLTLGAALAIAKSPSPPSPGDPHFAAYVMDKIDDLYRGKSSQSEMSMEIKTKHWTRTLTMESWSMGKGYSLVRILKPRKERGTATLKAKNDLFIYLNKTGRTIKITSGLMGGSWMGSHFTNDDLVKHSRMSRDYTMKYGGKSKRDGLPTYNFTLKAKPDAAVVWDKITVSVRQADLQPLHIAFYNEDGKKVRVQDFSDFKKEGGRLLPTKFVMKPLDKPGEYTAITLKKIKFDVSLSKDFFSLQKLKSI